MKIFTRNKNDKITRNELKQAAAFMFAHLVNEDVHSKTTLTIKSIPVKCKYGFCGSTVPINLLDNKFLIEINSCLTRKKQLTTLGHELVHVKQFIFKELGFSIQEKNICLTKWQTEYINENEISYWDLPWEIEAHGREYGLWRRWENWVREEKLVF